MADLYPTYSQQPRRTDSQQQQQQSPSYHNPSPVLYPPQLITNQSSMSDEHPNSPHHDSSSQSPTSQSPKQESPTGSKQDGLSPQPAKPQATFLTKLYALLDRPENQHMIRWDQAGEHIIVERPEQLALHVLPSVYRQSRFASFSRQLNIYGFMRKVNLRNVDPAIDDPDASTWSHPTLNRHSPPEVVANFKRRVPPRLPKPRKRDTPDTNGMSGPRSAVGMGPVSLAAPIGGGSPGKGWTSTGYSRNALPPLSVPSDPPSLSSQGSMYHSPHTLHTPSEDTQHSFSPMSYSTSPTHHRDPILMSSTSHYHHYQDTQSPWAFNASNGTSTGGSLSSLLNPTNHYNNPSRVPPAPPSSINTYASYPPVPIRPHNGSTTSLSPDSRPATGYSVSSMSSIPTPYEETAPASAHFGHQADYSRPNSSHHRPITPNSRPTSSKATPYPTSANSLSVRPHRRHSHAMSPYPSPYGDHPPHSAGSERPSTSPHPPEDVSGLPRVRSMVQMDDYGYNPAPAEFAYQATDDPRVSQSSYGGSQSMYGSSHTMGGANRSVRPSTSASSLSTASSAANTPGGDPYPGTGHGADINRFSPDFGFVAMGEQIPQYSKAELQ